MERRRSAITLTMHCNGRSDVWALRENSGSGKGTREPLPITTGPLSYHSPAPALSGNRLFVIGERQRAELQRLDPKSGQFVPFLNGISAGELDFSRDGRWVTYISYPDNFLWRSRIDGSDNRPTPSAYNAMPRWFRTMDRFRGCVLGSQAKSSSPQPKAGPRKSFCRMNPTGKMIRDGRRMASHCSSPTIRRASPAEELRIFRWHNDLNSGKVSAFMGAGRAPVCYCCPRWAAHLDLPRTSS